MEKSENEWCIPKLFNKDMTGAGVQHSKGVVKGDNMVGIIIIIKKNS